VKLEIGEVSTRSSYDTLIYNFVHDEMNNTHLENRLLTKSHLIFAKVITICTQI